MERKTLFVNVMLPLPVKGLFTYRVPFELNDYVEAGRRVAIQFGRRKLYTALIREVHEQIPQGYIPKYILSVLDERPIVNSLQFAFWEWIAEYYMCHIGEVMNAALPSAFKLASESKLSLHPGFRVGDVNLGEKESLIAEALIHREALTIKEASELTDQVKILPLVNTLIEKQVIILQEELKNRYKPQTETFITLSEGYQSEENLQAAFEKLEKRAFKQLQILLAYLKESSAEDPYPAISKPALLKASEGSYQQLNELIKKDIFTAEVRVVSRLHGSGSTHEADQITFNGAQNKALEEIKQGFEEKNVVLLHGVTSSGKTEIYIKLIEEVIRRGQQVLYLLPEIALTTQIIQRLQKFFGHQVGVYHSKYNEGERVEIWNKVSSEDEEDRYNIVLGARSAVFLPFNRLGLIIVDESHDQSYKQFDPAPRYHARDAATFLASLHNAKTLFGTATPSFESYFNSHSGKYALVSITKRYRDILLPEIILADFRREYRKKGSQSHFTSVLIKHIEAALANNEQVILFQNRRGFSPRLECELCGWVPMCTRCDITLTYHKKADHLRCHYCGYSTNVPHECGHCGSNRVLMHGFGTEKVEEELQLMFPDATIRRMDLDTTRNKHGHQKIINAFEKREIDILVGTQMVTKGLDFDHVNIVGILSADNLINFPDFRSFERSFQLMSQVAGRAGRKNKQGKVIIQTYNPEHEVIQDVVGNNYDELYKRQMNERNRFQYPPYYRLIQIRLLYKDYKLLNKASAVLAQQLNACFPNKVLGPEYPLVARIKNQYIKQVLIKANRKESVLSLKTELQKQLDDFYSITEYKKVRIRIDVDPY